MFNIFKFIFLQIVFYNIAIAQSNPNIGTITGKVDNTVMAVLPLDTLLLKHLQSKSKIDDYIEKIEKVVDAYAANPIDKQSCMKFIRTGMKSKKIINYYIIAWEYINNDLIERYALSDEEIKGSILEYTYRFALWKAFNCELGIKLVGNAVISVPPVNIPKVTQKITMSSYLSLEKKITYAKAVQILGATGKEQSRISIGGFETVGYTWKNSSNGVVNITFQNNELVAKAQSGL